MRRRTQEIPLTPDAVEARQLMFECIQENAGLAEQDGILDRLFQEIDLLYLTVGPGQFGMFVDTKGTAVTFQHVQITRL